MTLSTLWERSHNADNGIDIGRDDVSRVRFLLRKALFCFVVCSADSLEDFPVEEPEELAGHIGVSHRL